MEKINKEIDTYIDESLDSSRRIVGLTYLTKEVGTNIIEDLNEQSEKLTKLNEKSNKINKNLKITNSTLNKMKCCFFGCMKKNIIKENIEIDEEIEIDENYSVRKQGKNDERFVKNITGDQREEEINSNLKEADSIIKDIKSMSIIIGKEIDTQNKLIENITNNIENNNTNIKNVSNNMKGLQ
jgi:hypothetical protein